MNTIELRKSFFNEASAIIDNDELLEEATKLLRKLRTERATQTKPYTMEEIDKRIEASLADDAAGNVLTSRQVDQQMKEKFPFLCK